MEEFLEEPKTVKVPKHLFHLHRRLFLLVFAVAVLLQTAVFVNMRLDTYYQALNRSFKMILTVNGTPDNAKLAETGDSLNQKEDITDVKLFSPQDALAEVRRQNPQLADAMLLMGKNKMPAYYELRLSYKAINNIRPFADNLSAEYPFLTPHYNLQHAQLLFYVGCAPSC